MRFIVCFTALCMCFTNLLSAQPSWTAEEFESANTAAEVAELSTEEREVVRYMNLARLYPRKFAEVEVVDYYGGESFGDPSMLSDDRMTLLAELFECSPMPALRFSPQKQKEARCLAGEQSKNGEMGHKRHRCSQGEGGENCAYGSAVGREIVLQLLIDDGVEGVGHRSNSLNAGFAEVGVAIFKHPTARYGTVVDFAWGDYEKRTELKYPYPKDVEAGMAERYYKLMTRGVDPEIANSGAAHKRVLKRTSSQQVTSSSTWSKTEVVETWQLSDGSRLEVTTTTTVREGGQEEKSREVKYYD